ncbi:hypothetical protein DEVEQU_03277 [Devosia equisanguinis]|uniref:Glycosyltransferase 2-like domain-containing protein n=1 Tax=Devosia equisanguinis TaxID=2490941 RepID=A0A3S4CEC2_9HYPH|nr:glycosyltransferase family 2 protein [Devosia equisanguinis]VDS06124.1 hypothetical protein DEVEQU_03277 [Devosia equisanguinis]
MTAPTIPELSIVIPMKDEQDGLASLFFRLLPTLRSLGRSFEVVCVNDGSHDNTVTGLVGLQRAHPEIVIVDLSRNFGKEAALTAGIQHARGNAVIPLDADLQDPPEIIPEMTAKWDSGAEVVIAVRSKRETDSAFKRWTASAFYRTINQMSEVSIPNNAGDFRLMSRPVVNALLSLPERNRFNKGLFAWLGFRTEVVYYERPKRELGTSKWAYRRLWSFAVDGITAFSSLPIRIWTYVGLAFAAFALIYGGVMIFRALILDNIDVPGYASLMVAILFSSGVILTGLGVIGEYVSRIYIEVKGRPLYVVRTVIRAETSAQRR